MKKITQYLGVFVLVLFSFYYTDRAVDIVKRNDPIYETILEVSSEYKIDSIKAEIVGDTIIPGLNGVMVDVDESYKKMKNLNEYYESMLTFKSVLPDESILNNFNKFIIKGNNYKNEIAIILKVTSITNLEKIEKIFEDRNIDATLFIDGTVIENNIDLVKKLSNVGFEIENYGYDLDYTNEMFNWTNNMLYSITNEEPVFCYSDSKNYEILKLCSKSQMYTVIPNVIVTSNPYMTIKNTLEDGNIISLNVTEETIKELPTILSYIRQKGYDLVTLKELINEKVGD